MKNSLLKLLLLLSTLAASSCHGFNLFNSSPAPVVSVSRPEENPLYGGRIEPRSTTVFTASTPPAPERRTTFQTLQSIFGFGDKRKTNGFNGVEVKKTKAMPPPQGPPKVDQGDRVNARSSNSRIFHPSSSSSGHLYNHPHGQVPLHIRTPNALDATVHSDKPTLPFILPHYSPKTPDEVYSELQHGGYDGRADVNVQENEEVGGRRLLGGFFNSLRMHLPNALDATAHSNNNNNNNNNQHQQQQQQQQYQTSTPMNQQIFHQNTQGPVQQQQQFFNGHQQPQQQQQFRHQQQQTSVTPIVSNGQQFTTTTVQQQQFQQLRQQPQQQQFNQQLHNNNINNQQQQQQFQRLQQQQQQQQQQQRQIQRSGMVQQCENRYQQLVSDIFMANEIVPELFDSPPQHLLEVSYRTTRTYPGMKLTADVTRGTPMLSWPADPNAHYTVIMSNLDINSRNNRTLAEFWHWFVGNVPGTNIDDGDEIFALLHPLVLPDGDGDHRFAFYVLKQPNGEMDFSAEGGPTDSCSPGMSEGRGPFRSTSDFMNKYNMEFTAATFLIVDYSEASNEIACEWQNCMQGQVFLQQLNCDQAVASKLKSSNKLRTRERLAPKKKKKFTVQPWDDNGFW